MNRAEAALEIPHIEFPFPPRRNARGDGIEDHLLSWVRRHGLVRSGMAERRFRHARFGEFIRWVYPLSDNLELAGEWNTWLFMFDDQFDDGPIGRQPERVASILHELMCVLSPTLESVPDARSSIGAALADLWPRMAASMSRSWRARFITHLHDYFHAYRQETDNRHRGVVPDLAGYLALRRGSGGVPTSLDLLEVCGGRGLPAAVTGSLEYHRVVQAASDLICWTNDIISVNKERARGELNNLVVVLHHAGSGAWPDCLREACDMVAARWRDFLACHDVVLSMRVSHGVDGSDWEFVEHCLLAMKYWIVGSLRWHLDSPRYHDIDPTAPGQSPRYLEDLVEGVGVG
jgi:hypothetical protein